MPGPTFAAGSLTYISDLNTLSNAILTTQKQGINFSAVRGMWYMLTAAALTITMPASPAAGDLIRTSPATTSVQSVTFARNGNNIDSTAADLSISGGTERSLNIWLVYVDASIGWRSIQNTLAGWLQFGGTQNANFNAARNTAYVATASTFVATLPPSPFAGDQVKVTAADHTITAITLGRNGANINSAAADLVINAKGWEVLATYVNVTIGWLITFDSTINPQPRYDSVLNELRYYDTQRERSDELGWMPYALPLGAAFGDNYSTQAANASQMPVSGGSQAIPIQVVGHMLLESLTVRQGDISGLHTAEWRLYKQPLNNGNVGEATVNEVPGANGTFSFTPGVAGIFTSTATTNGLYLAPGLYWLVLRNTSATVAFSVNYLPTPGSPVTGGKSFQTKTLGSALGSTLDLLTGWTVATIGTLGIKLNGRVFGQTSSLYA